MNRCDECKHKASCVCVPYGCESFEIDLSEHDKQIRAEVIDECQDLSTMQHKLVDNLIKQGHVQRWIAVGDRN